MALITESLIFILFVILTWYYWRYTISVYAEFPSYSLGTALLYERLTQKISRDVPLTARVFQIATSHFKTRESEGLCLVWLLKPLLFIFGEEAVKIFSNENEALDKSSRYKILEGGFGKGLVTSNGVAWRKHRKLLNPVFHHGMLKEKISIFNEHAEVLVKELAEESKKPSIKLISYMKSCGFGIICESILDLKMDTPENKVDVENFIEMINKLSQSMAYRMTHPWLHYDFLQPFFSSGRLFKQRINEINRLTRKEISAMSKTLLSRKVLDVDSNDLNKTRKSFIHILLDFHEKDSSFTIDDVLNQVITFIGAGYDTVAYTMTWCLFLLGHHPEIQEQVHNELEKTLSGKYITYEDLLELEYLDCVIRETLRLYPTVPFYARHLNKEVQCGKYKVPKGTEIAFCPYMLHRNSEIYPDPEKFDPQRFSGQQSVKSPWNYTPFSEGIRSCIGKKFALLEMKVVLAYIVRNFKITALDKKEDVDLTWEIVLAPVKPLRFYLSSRHE